ncbi:MAG: UbiA family prenyltransferase [Candidatus Omnitrophica bacterium]|nr:UbiA family prenyltransferase [Candidatus Omnitrophota bacterium]
MIYKLKVYVELVRPFTLIAPMVGFLLGAVIAAGTMPNLTCLLGALSAAILNGASNVINQYFDLEIDKINKPFRPLASGRISKREIINFSFILYFSALFLSSLVNLKLFFIILITAIISFYYSVPHLRAKRYPFLSNLFIALPRGMLLIVAGWSVSKLVFNIQPWFIGLIFALYLAGAATTKDFSDIKGDGKFGIKTLPVLYGVKRATQMITLFFYLPFYLFLWALLCI